MAATSNKAVSLRLDNKTFHLPIIMVETKPTTYVPYKVKDLSLAEWGRKEIRLAEAEMPGLMSLREEFGASQPALLAACT